LCPFFVLFNILAEMVMRDFKVDYKLEGQGHEPSHADDIILLATSEAELQELLDRLD